VGADRPQGIFNLFQTHNEENQIEDIMDRIQALKQRT